MSNILTEDVVVNKTDLGGKLTKVRISVYGAEGEHVPHFHIHPADSKFDKKMMPNGDCCIKICEAEYFEHGNHLGKLNNNQAKNLNDLLKQKYKHDPRISNWQAIFNYWKINLDSNLQPCLQPDYSRLNK